MARSPILSAAVRHKSGLAHWMNRVLRECHRAADSFHPDAVHDLRVALRRCRSIADAMCHLDPDPAWRDMKSAAARLFRALGALRDNHVLFDWVTQLSPPDDPVGGRMLQLLHENDEQLTARARRALSRFDRKNWKRLARHLSRRTDRVPLARLVAHHLALERFTDAHAAHRRALRNRSSAAWHHLRIRLKRFRYTVENFLPQRHAAWGADLKSLQDLLGEVHDFDVLLRSLRQSGAISSSAELADWRARLDPLRTARLSSYRQKMTGKNSLWTAWRSGLPSGRRLETASLAVLRSWATYLDPAFPATHHFARLTIQLYDGLRAVGLPPAASTPRARLLIYAAALTSRVGLAKRRRRFTKSSARLLRKRTPPIGWTARDLHLASLIVRSHRGKPPSPHKKRLAPLTLDEKSLVITLSAILRLARAFAFRPEAAVPRLDVENSLDAVILRARGYSAEPRFAAQLAAKRFPLEQVLSRPVVIRPHFDAPGVIPFPSPAVHRTAS